MASRVGGKGALWAALFALVLLALFDIFATESVIVDFFTGGSQPSEGPLEQAVDRVLDGRRR